MQIIRPMIRDAAARYATEKKLTRRSCEAEMKEAAGARKSDTDGSEEIVQGAGMLRMPATDAAKNRPVARMSSLLVVNGIEVIYNHVILVLKGVSLTVPEGGIVALLGANGAGKTTTLRAVSNLLHAERGDVTKGSIEYEGERIQGLTAYELVKRGVVQVMEGRRCFRALDGRGQSADRRIFTRLVGARNIACRHCG